MKLKPLSKLADYLTLIFKGIDLKTLEDERYDEDEEEPDNYTFQDKFDEQKDELLNK